MIVTERRTIATVLAVAAFAMGLIGFGVRSYSDTPIVTQCYYAVPDSSQTPCVYQGDCGGTVTIYCDGGSADPVPGLCMGPANMTACTDFGATSCGNAMLCAMPGVATTSPPTPCGTTVVPTQSIPGCFGF